MTKQAFNHKDLVRYYVRGYTEALEVIEQFRDLPTETVLALAYHNVDKIKTEAGI
jgi:hypothetical protein